MKQSVLFFLMSLFSSVLIAQVTRGNDTTNYSLDVSQYGALSVMAVDVSTGKVIVEHNPQQRMTPASLTKVITTGAVLSTFQPDYKFETHFYISKADGKTNIVVKGFGDPTLGSERFDETKPEYVFSQLAIALKDENISSIDNIIIDNSFFSGVKLPSKRLWEDVGNYYGAVPNGLTYRENTFYLIMQSPKGIGLPVEIVKTEPEIDVRLNCLVTTANNNKDSAYIYGHPTMKEWYVSGTIPQGRNAFTIKGALPAPEMTFAHELRDYLNNQGIVVNGVEKRKNDNRISIKPLYIHYSPELIDIASVVNKTSHNLWADHLMFLLAQQQLGEANWDNGVKSLHRFWGEAVPDFSGLFFDGSGLSPFNAFSARDMVEVLRYMNGSDNSEAFKQTLSVAGIDGTLRSILKEEGFKGQLIGKSGSLNGVLGYCGYITTQQGKTIAFCIIANRFTESFGDVRQNMERLMKEIIIQN